MQSQPKRATWPWVVLRLLLSGAALTWVLHRIDFDSVLNALRGTNGALFALGVSLYVATRLAAAERTQVMNRGLNLDITRRQTIETLFVSNFYSLLSPGPWLSGMVTVYRYRGYGASMTASVTSLLASRIIECSMYLFWGFACILLDPRVSNGAIRYPLQLAAIALAAGCVVIAIVGLIRRPLPATHARFEASKIGRTRIASKLREVWNQILLQGPAILFKTALPASLQVLLSGAAVMVLARSLHIEIDSYTGVWISAAVYFAFLLPISILGLGVREVTLIKAFALLGLPGQAAVALSVLLLSDQLVSASIGGCLQLRSLLLRGRRPF